MVQIFLTHAPTSDCSVAFGQKSDESVAPGIEFAQVIYDSSVILRREAIQRESRLTAHCGMVNLASRAVTVAAKKGSRTVIANGAEYFMLLA